VKLVGRGWRAGLLVAVLCRPAAANTGDDKAAAEALFEQGKVLMEKHAFAEACPKFEASQALDSGIGTLLYLGDCYEQIGRFASAWASFREAASQAAAAGQEQRRQIAQARARALEPRLVTLTIEVSPDNAGRPGFEVRRDGVLIPKAGLGTAIPVDPGEHTIAASAPGKQSYSEQITITRESRRLTIPELQDQPSSAPPEPMRPANGETHAAGGTSPTSAPAVLPGSPPPAGRTQRGFAYAAGVAGLVGLGIGSSFGIVALDRNSKSKDQCRPGDASLCSPRGVKLRSDAQSAATVSTVAFAAGGTLLAAGFVLWLTTPSNAERNASVSLSTSLTPVGPAVELGGRW
jgi:hypothetical protein